MKGMSSRQQVIVSINLYSMLREEEHKNVFFIETIQNILPLCI